MSLVAQAEKSKVVEKITSEVQDASVVIFADFRGLTAGEMTQLRRLLQSEGACVSVYKNSLTRRALDKLSISYPENFLMGPSAIVHTSGDAVKTTKVLVNYAKEVDKLTIKGGLLDKAVLNQDTIKALAELPGREELLSKVLGAIQSPLRKLVLCLSSPTRGLVYALHAIKENKSEV